MRRCRVIDPPAMPFTRNDLDFSEDVAGAELPAGQHVEFELDYEELGIDPESAPEQLGAILSALLGSSIDDEEGLFDLAVHDDGELVATLTLSCEDDALEVVGERAASIPEATLADALLSALPRQ